MNKVSDKQLADDIEELLKANDVDESVILKAVSMVNEGDNGEVDADGEEVDLFSDKEYEEKSENPKQEQEAEDEEPKENLKDEELEKESDGEEIPEEEIPEEENVEEVIEKEEEVEEDDGEEVTEDPLKKLEDPQFREAFDKGYQFCLALMKNGMLPEMEVKDDDLEDPKEKIVKVKIEKDVTDSDEEEVESVTDSEDEEVTDSDDEEKEKIVADSIDKIKSQIKAEMTQLFKTRVQAAEKVKPLVGNIPDVTVFDSGEAVYKFALEQNGVNTKKYKPAAYEGMVDVMLEKLDSQMVNMVVGDSKPRSEFNAEITEAFNYLKNIEK